MVADIDTGQAEMHSSAQPANRAVETQIENIYRANLSP